MNELFKSYHKVFKLKYHFVFVIKYRKDLFLNEDYIQTLKEICHGLEERYTMKFETMGLMKTMFISCFNQCQNILLHKYSD